MRLSMSPSPVEPEMRYANRGGGGIDDVEIGCSFDSTKTEARAVAER